jgi:hypothetical protein
VRAWPSVCAAPRRRLRCHLRDGRSRHRHRRCHACLLGLPLGVPPPAAPARSRFLVPHRRLRRHLHHGVARCAVRSKWTNTTSLWQMERGVCRSSRVGALRAPAGRRAKQRSIRQAASLTYFRARCAPAARRVKQGQIVRLKPDLLLRTEHDSNFNERCSTGDRWWRLAALESGRFTPVYGCWKNLQERHFAPQSAIHSRAQIAGDFATQVE